MSLPIAPLLASAQVPNADLVLVFLFVLAVVVIKQIASWHQRKLWHETARAALEKGQPLPFGDEDPLPRAMRKLKYFKRHPMIKISQGVTLAAIGVGLYYAAPSGLGNWWILPVLIGGAQVITGLLMFIFRDDSDNRAP